MAARKASPGVSAAVMWKYGTAAEWERDPVKQNTEKYSLPSSSRFILVR